MILAIAGNTFRETVRDRVLYNLLIFALALFVAAWVVSHWSMGQEVRILKNFGLSAMSLTGLLMAVFIGIGLVYKEIDRRTIYVILARPIRRYEFIIGKYLGLLLTLALNFAVMSLALFCMLGLFEVWPDWRLLVAVGAIFLEMMVIMAFALCFSAVTTPPLSAMFAIIVYVGGHLSSEITILGSGVDSPAFSRFLNLLHYLMPNLENFNLKTAIAYNLPLTMLELSMVLAYGLTYTIAVLAITIILFERRNFT